jgi:hypothetical protein
MKPFRFLATISLITILGNSHVACKKGNKGKVTAEIQYRGQELPEGPSGALDSLRHTGLGTYITSITPDSFKGKFYTMRFQDNYGEGAFMMELIANNIEYYNPKRIADFSSGNEVVLEPQIFYASDRVIKSKTFNLVYFYWDLAWFHQVFQLPAAYDGVGLMSLQDEFSYNNMERKANARNNLTVRCDHYPMFGNMYGQPPGEIPRVYVFGNTDSSFIFNKELKTIGYSKDNPMSATTNASFFRSNKYEAINFNYSEVDDLKIRATVIFDFKDLIQIYAGKDNLPYTFDDVLTYAPRFWERLKVKVVQQ